jgi:hypothetical protein
MAVLPVDLVSPTTEAPAMDERLDELLPEILAGITSMRPDSRVKKTRKNMTNCLSSNQLFFGGYDSHTATIC